MYRKKYYEFNNEYIFKDKLNSGIFSVTFFFKDKEGNIIIYDTDKYAYNSESMFLFNLSTKGTVLIDEKNYRITYYERKSDVTFITFNGTKTTKETEPFGLSFIMQNGWNLISVAQDNDTQYQDLCLDDFRNVVTPIIINKEVYIVYDPTIKSDSMFILNCVKLAYPASNILPIENGTHAILQTMLKAGVLKLYINSIVANKYNDDICNYIKAKCKFFQKSEKEAFMILDKVFIRFNF